VARPFGISLPVEAERAAVQAARQGDLPAALKALARPVRQALESAARGDGADEPGELYNAGAALSQEALDAFLAAVRGERVIRETVLDPSDVPERLRSQWWFGGGPQELLATFEPDGTPVELFRRAGRAALKGLGDLVVWEMCPDAGAPRELLRTLGKSWFRGG
jgi:hypothetical protein